MGYFHDTADIVAEELRRAGFPQFDEALSVGGGVEFYWDNLSRDDINELGFIAEEMEFYLHPIAEQVIVNVRGNTARMSVYWE